MNRFLRDFCEAAYLLARFATWASGGRAWELAIQRVLHDHAATATQGPYNLHLFGMRSASGASHELDGAAGALATTILTESKDLRNGISKDDLCIFDRKTFDYYVNLVRRNLRGFHYRVLASATAIDVSLRRYGFLYGIILVEPSVCPLPLLLAVAEKPESDALFPEGLIGDFLDLTEQACSAMEGRFVPDGRYLRFDTKMLPESQLDDLIYLQEEFSELWLDFLDHNRPNYYELRAEAILERVGI